MGYEYLNSGQARACKRDLIRFSLNWFGTCKRGYRRHANRALTLKCIVRIWTSGGLSVDWNGHFFEYLVLAYTIDLMNDLGFVR